MCGIAGILAWHPDAAEPGFDELRRIRDHMERRGPDGAGEWRSADGRALFGHRRLSIIDLSERGAQPMRSADGLLTITFNGEIYNYRDLRAALLRDGVVFASDTDTEVLLHLYARHGAGMLGMLRGMFAFALHDARDGSVLLARDPYGIKPLYYADDGRVLRFASQVRALLAGGGVPSAPDPAALAGFLLLGSVPEPLTVYEAVRPVPAGSSIRVDAHGLGSPQRFFSIPSVLADAASSSERRDSAALGEESLTRRIRDAVRDSVVHHMIADVPVGAFLSAGIDSGTLVALARDAGVERLQTITLAFEEYQGRHDDEAPLAAEVADWYGTDHRTRLLGLAEFEADLERLLDAMDQPSIDGINTYYVSKAAAELGLKVALSGLGGDELFAGYNTFVDVPRWVRLFGPFSQIPGAPAAFRRVWTSVAAQRSSRSPKVAGALEYGGRWSGAWLLRRGLFLPWELDALLGRDLARAALERLRPLDIIEHALHPDPGTPYGRVAAMEAGLYMRNQLLRDTDWAGMAHSLEVRVPLVDAELLRTLAPLLIDAAPRYRKELLARAPSRPLPDHIRRRAKTGFQVPIREWLERHPAIDAWRREPALRREGTPWARRWAYTLLEPFRSQL